jgi:hypothetical protein
MEEIYGVNYNSSIYQFAIQTGDSRTNTITTIDVNLKLLHGLDGSTSGGLLGLSLLSSSEELCATFFPLWNRGVKYYTISLSLYAAPDSNVSIRGLMSLPNQARNFDRLRLFPKIILPDNKKTTLEISVYSLKFLQKRNTVAEPCIHVDNYDKV